MNLSSLFICRFNLRSSIASNSIRHRVSHLREPLPRPRPHRRATSHPACLHHIRHHILLRDGSGQRTPSDLLVRPLSVHHPTRNMVLADRVDSLPPMVQVEPRRRRARG